MKPKFFLYVALLFVSCHFTYSEKPMPPYSLVPPKHIYQIVTTGSLDGWRYSFLERINLLDPPVTVVYKKTEVGRYHRYDELIVRDKSGNLYNVGVPDILYKQGDVLRE